MIVPRLITFLPAALVGVLIAGVAAAADLSMSTAYIVVLGAAGLYVACACVVFLGFGVLRLRRDEEEKLRPSPSHRF